MLFFLELIFDSISGFCIGFLPIESKNCKKLNVSVLTAVCDEETYKISSVSNNDIWL